MGVAAVFHLYVFPTVPYKCGERCVRDVSVMSDYASLGAPPDPEEVRDCEKTPRVCLGHLDERPKCPKLHQSVRDVVFRIGEILNLNIPAICHKRLRHMSGVAETSVIRVQDSQPVIGDGNSLPVDVMGRPNLIDLTSEDIGQSDTIAMSTNTHKDYKVKASPYISHQRNQMGEGNSQPVNVMGRTHLVDLTNKDIGQSKRTKNHEDYKVITSTSISHQPRNQMGDHGTESGSGHCTVSSPYSADGNIIRSVINDKWGNQDGQRSSKPVLIW